MNLNFLTQSTKIKIERILKKTGFNLIIVHYNRGKLFIIRCEK